MLIVFDGADKTGKTTLFNQFIAELPEPFTIIRHTPITKEMFEHGIVDFVGRTEYNIIKQMYDSNKIYVIDRFIPSNMVYPIIFNRDNVDLSYNNESDFNIWYVHVTADPDEVINRERSEDKYEHAKYIYLLIKEYEKFFSTRSNNTITINTTTEPMDSRVQRIRDFIKV
jgi:thymidylate kinase